jgi:hypothetical protein
MRSYIFSKVERDRIHKFLSGAISRNDLSLKMIVSRARHFDELAADVELYARFREAITAGSAEKPLKAVASE